MTGFESVAVGYLGAVVFVITQLLLAFFLLLSGVINLFFLKKEGKWLKRFALVSQIPNLYHRHIGITKIILGFLLFVPFLTGATYLISVTACIIALALFIYLEKQIDQGNKRPGLLLRYLVISLAIIAIVSNIFEGKDAFVIGNSLATRMSTFGEEERKWQDKHNPHVPKVGEMATDFEVINFENTNTIRLSDFRDQKPVALIFGSYT